MKIARIGARAGSDPPGVEADQHRVDQHPLGKPSFGKHRGKHRGRAAAGVAFEPLRSGGQHLKRAFDTVSARMVAIILLASLPIAALCGMLSWHNYELASGVGGGRAVAAAASLRSHTEQELSRAAALASDLATLDGLDDPAACSRTLGLVMRTQEPRYQTLRLRGRDGELLCTVGVPTVAPQQDAAVTDATDGLQRVVPRSDPGSGPMLVAQLSWRGSTLGGRRLVGELPLGWSRRQLFGADGHAGLLEGTLPIRAWLLAPGGVVVSACQDCGWVLPADFDAIRTLAQDGAGAPVQIDGMQATVASLAGPVQLLAVASPTPQEQRALSVFIIRVIGIVLLLGVGLVGVSLGANLLVVTPLQRLTAAVTHWRKVGGYDPHESRLMPVELRSLSHAFTQATRSLAHHEQTLHEAETRQALLIKEIHHRVKNNLQIIASLLNLQANRIRQPEARAEFASARDRVRALATLHRYLYSEGELETLNMRLFLQELCAQLFQAIGEKQGRRIQLHIEAPEIAMATDQAVPLALVVTEAVSNAIKYAFPGGRSGHVTVVLSALGDPRDLQAHGEGMARLVIEDDGVGIPAGRAETETGIRDGLGIQLIRGFARQLGAVLEVREGGSADGAGTRYALTFPLHPKEADVALVDPGAAE